MNKTIHIVLPKSADGSRPTGFIIELDLAIKRFSRMVPEHEFLIHEDGEAYRKHLVKSGVSSSFCPVDHEHYGHLDEIEQVVGSIQAPSGVRV